jgi:hypothetical protein
VVGTLGVEGFTDLRTHFNVFPTLEQVNVTPLVFCTTPTFEHLPPFEAASAVEIANAETGSRHRASTPSVFLHEIIPQNIMRTMEATPGIEIHQNRNPQSHSAPDNHFFTRVKRPTSCQSPSFRISVHGVVPNPYQHLNHQSGITRVFKVRAQPSVRLLLSPAFSQQKGNLEVVDC